MIDPRLLNHPKVREEAERQTVEHRDAWQAVNYDPGLPALPPWEFLSAHHKEDCIAPFIRLLSNPTRPETICFFAHDLIEDYWQGKHGIEPIQIRLWQNERTRSGDERIISEWLKVNS